MTDRCEKCGRPLATELGAGRDRCTDVPGIGTVWEAFECVIFAAGRRAGMREAIAVAKEHAWADDDSGPDDDARDLWIDWSDVNAEIARRLGDG